MFETKHWVFQFTNEWSQCRGKFNWYSFTFIQVYFEKDTFTHGYEFHFTLFGLGFYIRYNTGESLKLFERWEKEIEDSVDNSK